MSLVVAGNAVADPPPRGIQMVPRGPPIAPTPNDLVGVSDHIVHARRWVVANGPLLFSAVITGETGTGKGLVARLLHAHSARAGPFVQRGAGETAPTLLQDDLFGHVRGAFTGATERRVGLLEAAHLGSFFLDEVQDLLPEGQRALLLFLDGHGFAPLGSSRRIYPDVRFIAATQRPLRDLAQEGTLRWDLLYRIRQVTITLRSLRERPEDVAPIAEAVLRGLRAGGAEGAARRRRVRSPRR